MPLITTCPACQAKFVVSAAQLEAHHGDVRCGKCKHVFNALAHLESLPDAEGAPKQIDANQIDSDTSALVESSTTTSFENTEDVQGALFTEETASINSEMDVEQAESEASEENAPIEPENSEVEASEPLAANQATVIPAFDAANFQLETTTEGKPSKKTKAKSSIQTAPSPLESSSLDLQPSTFAWLNWLIVVVLLVAAGLQATYYFRTEISAQYPELKPYLIQACDALGCKIELPKQASLLVIDDSDLQEDAEREGLIRLNTTLLNRAEYALAYPLLEITLTDATDKVLMRKRFKPSEYLPPETPVAEGIPGNDSVYVHLALTANKHAVSGYRLFITY